MVKAIRRGQIWIVDFDPTEGHEQRGLRPAVVMSSNSMDTDVIGLAYVIPGTTTKRVDSQNRPVPNHVQVNQSSSNGLSQITFFMAEQLRSVSVSRFQKRLGQITDQQLFELEEILILLLDLGPK